MDRDYFVFTFTQGYLFRLYFIVLYSNLSAWLRFEIEIVLLKSTTNFTVCYKTKRLVIKLWKLCAK